MSLRPDTTIYRQRVDGTFQSWYPSSEAGTAYFRGDKAESERLTWSELIATPWPQVFTDFNLAEVAISPDVPAAEFLYYMPIPAGNNYAYTENVGLLSIFPPNGRVWNRLNDFMKLGRMHDQASDISDF